MMKHECTDFNELSTQDLQDLLKFYRGQVHYVSEDDPEFDWIRICFKHVLEIKKILNDREEVLSYND